VLDIPFDDFQYNTDAALSRVGSKLDESGTKSSLNFLLLKKINI
jgi:hypothetical protein